MFVSTGTASSSRIDAHVDIARPQKYLVRGETTSDDFFRCGGEYSNDAAKGLRVDLVLNRESNSEYVTMAPNADARYVFNCEPPMPLEKEKLVLVNSAYCTLGIVVASAGEDAGWYSCQAQGNASFSAAGNVVTYLRVWGERRLF